MWLEFSLHLLSYWGAVWIFDRAAKETAAVWMSLYNQFTITLPLMYLFDDTYSYTVDSFPLTAAKMAGVFILSNVLFYSTHRLLHTRILYPIHSIHHRYRDPIGVCALYAHPIEHLFANNLCFVLPIVVCRLNYYWMLLILCLSSFNIVWAHARVESNVAHRLHHLLYTVNYGFFGLVDRLLSSHTDSLTESVRTKAKHNQAM